MPKTAKKGVLALDLGTSSVRAVVYDIRGRMVEATLCDLPYKVRTVAPGEVSSNADELVDLIGYGKRVGAEVRRDSTHSS